MAGKCFLPACAEWAPHHRQSSGSSLRESTSPRTLKPTRDVAALRLVIAILFAQTEQISTAEGYGGDKEAPVKDLVVKTTQAIQKLESDYVKK